MGEYASVGEVNLYLKKKSFFFFSFSLEFEVQFQRVQRSMKLHCASEVWVKRQTSNCASEAIGIGAGHDDALERE